MTRRSISMLAAGLLAAATLLPTVGAASAGTTAAGSPPCPEGHATYFTHRSLTGTLYFLGVPNTPSSGSTVRLKPTGNHSTVWCVISTTSGPDLITSRGGQFALTSRATSPGADVTLESPGNAGSGFASQHWTFSHHGIGAVALTNAKTGLALRVRNSGPKIYQTVTTGHKASSWDLSGTGTGAN